MRGTKHCSRGGGALAQSGPIRQSRTAPRPGERQPRPRRACGHVKAQLPAALPAADWPGADRALIAFTHGCSSHVSLRPQRRAACKTSKVTTGNDAGNPVQPGSAAAPIPDEQYYCSSIRNLSSQEETGKQQAEKTDCFDPPPGAGPSGCRASTRNPPNQLCLKLSIVVLSHC